MICIDCVEIEPLRRFVTGNGASGTCAYCRKEKICTKKQAVFEYILACLDKNTALDKDLSQFEYWSFYDGGSDDIDAAFFDVVVAEWLGIDNASVTNDIYEYAPESYKRDEKGIDVNYFRDDGNLERNFIEDEWSKFISGISHSHRFFNPKAKEFLDTVFSRIVRSDGKLKPECITVVNHGDVLYRARTVADYDAARKLEDDPANQFGPPPRGGTGSQRMTPSGISAMYCGFERETCLSEIRAITGDFVVSAGLTPAAPMSLLNLSSLDQEVDAKLTIMDEDYIHSVHLTAFLKSLVNKMSKPKGRNDELSYLSTQVVFEYLRLKFQGQVDGLIYPSVQTGGKGRNAVIFPECSIVSKEAYLPYEDLFGAKKQPPPMPSINVENSLEEPPRLMFVKGSLTFHKITAIVTNSKDYHRINDLFMADLDRRRLNIP
ncbi:RES family NAD+ phosphorylase [Alcaligenes sp. SJTW-7]|uniref:RES family NAD+ phosphorylase n=1 Tax=Alcaligenes sp. SJTW-7 TaxID=3078429 RepID=UPI0039E9D983